MSSTDLSFDTFKNAGILSPLETQRMNKFSPFLTQVHALFQAQQSSGAISPVPLSQDMPTRQILAIPSSEPQEYLHIFLKLFSNLHVEAKLQYLMEMFVWLLFGNGDVGEISTGMESIESQMPKKGELPQGSQEMRHALRDSVLASGVPDDQDDNDETSQNHAQVDEQQTDVYDSFIRHLEKPSLAPYAYKCLMLMFHFKMQARQRIPREPLQQYISAISSAITNMSQQQQPMTRMPVSQTIVVHALMEILKHAPARPLFHEARGIPQLINLIKPPYSDMQLVYEVCFCIWVLTFNDNVIRYFQHENIVPKLHDVLRHVKKEKVVRIVLSTFKNMIAHQSFVSNMISVSVPKTLLSLKKRNFEDSDISQLLTEIFEKIEVQIDELSSFDEYRQEVLSGHLVWSPVHTSQKFWKENLKKLQDDDFRMLRALAKILENSKTQSPLNLAIALHDLGMFVQFHPRGKRIVADLGAKNNIIILCEHENEEVKKQALSTTQKLLLSSALW
mmetsp:Transcript_5211/g.19496  ORF Transcript_5211/g.19496 Transcript_5211/m.19496 type:complete len:504 (-) Transcript_5211:2205-3716(-)